MRANFLIFLATAFLLAGCSTPLALVAPRQEASSRLSAGPTDESLNRMVHHEKTGLSYAFEYDNENLYIILSTADQDVQRKISYFGFTVWIDKNGGNNKEQGFRFPLGTDMGLLSRGNIQGNANGRGAVMQRFPAEGTVKSTLEKADEIELIGIYGSSTRKVNIRDSRIRVHAEVVNDELLYKAIIPYEILQFGFDPLTHNESLSIGFETGNFEPVPMERRQRVPDNDRQGGGMVPGRGGQMPGQAAGRMPERMQRAPSGTVPGELSKPTRLWVNLEFTP